MSIRWQQYKKSDLNAIHEATLQIFKKIGIRFFEPEAVEIFKQNGVKTDGDIVYIDENTVNKALKSVPSRFLLEARNPDNNLIFDIEENTLVVSPTLGPVFMSDELGNRRNPTMDDYNDVCKLVQTSDAIDMNGISMVTPSELPQNLAHLDMLLSNILYCDKAFMGGAFTREAAIDSIEMAGILWGGKENIKSNPVMICNVSGVSPLLWSKEMAGSLIEYARYGQVLRIQATASAGSTAPIKIPGMLAQVNAEILSGIVLSQLVNPGVPVIYSSSSGPMDMRTGALSSTAPEVIHVKNWVTQMGHYYRMPTRNLGATADANSLDYQAGIESALTLMSSITNGANFILQSFGTLNTGMSLNLEKFIIDEELFKMIMKAVQPVEVNDETINLSLIEEVGIGGQYLTHPNTFEHCRTEYFDAEIMKIQQYDDWRNSGANRIEGKAKEVLKKRLTAYEMPQLNPEIEKELRGYMEKRKDGKLG